MNQKTPQTTAPSARRRRGRRTLATSLCTSLAAVLAATAGVAALTQAHPGQIRDAAATTNPVTPGNFLGTAFDQCRTPSQAAMDTWLNRSPYLGVGIYIAGTSRGCLSQPHLTPTWVHTQLAKGWKLLPITVGPQASCNPHFPRYSTDFKISAAPGPKGTYPTAYAEGVHQAARTISTAKGLGIVPGSAMYYDIEAFNIGNTACRLSALHFLSGWTVGIHRAGYVSGVYSSASSGITALEQARRTGFAMSYPDQIWIGDWDGKNNTSTSYVSATDWASHQRIKQFRGGHNETYGGVTINIDRDTVDVGRGLVARAAVTYCGGVRLDLPSYPVFNLGVRHPDPAKVKAIKCLLRQRGLLTKGDLSGTYGPYVRAAVHQWKASHHWRITNAWYREDWVSLLASGRHRVIKFGSAGEDVRALQRTLNADNPALHLPITGAFAASTGAALRAYETKIRLKPNGIANAAVWGRLAAGRV